MRKTRVYGWLTVVFGLGLGVAGGCGGRAPVGSVSGGVSPGKPCAQGSTIAKAADDCNICSCSNGTWSCTNETCGGSQTCRDGESKPADDGCNTCSCSGGVWGCTLKACPTQCKAGDSKRVDCNICGCTSDGQWACTDIACNCSGKVCDHWPDLPCADGDRKPASDGCNTCTCERGVWGCTLIGCNNPAACVDGQVMAAPDGCNTCTCTGGGWACTEKACPPNPACRPGDTMKEDCNTCSCQSNGEWACTLILCADGGNSSNPNVCPPPAPDNGTACPPVVVYAKDPSTGACCEYGDPCRAPSGWVKYSSLADCTK